MNRQCSLFLTAVVSLSIGREGCTNIKWPGRTIGGSREVAEVGRCPGWARGRGPPNQAKRHMWCMLEPPRNAAASQLEVLEGRSVEPNLVKNCCSVGE
jgi:hypothetical protein